MLLPLNMLQVPLDSTLCGTNRDAACTAGTYRVAVIAGEGTEVSLPLVGVVCHKGACTMA